MTDHGQRDPSGSVKSPLLPAAEAAERLGVSASTVRREIADGRLRAIRIRRLVRIHENEIARYIAQQEVTALRPSPAVDVAVSSALASLADATVDEFGRRQHNAPKRGRSKLWSTARRR